MLNITNYQGNEDQNHNEKSPHTHKNVYYQKSKQKKNKQNKITSVKEDVEKLEPSCCCCCCYCFSRV